MKKFIFLIILAGTILVSSDTYGQYYLNSAGIRIGGSYGLTYKKFFDQTQAFELLLGGRNDGLHLTGTYQFNKPLNLSKNETFFIYYGGGGHAGYERYNTKVLTQGVPGDPNSIFFTYENKTYFAMGIDAIFGLEYRFLTAPLTIGLDIKPYFTFIGFRYTRSSFWDTSLSVKYTF